MPLPSSESEERELTPPRELAQITALIQPQLVAVEESILQQVQAFDPAVQGYVAYACGSSGKRLRPALALLAAGATGGIDARHVSLATIIELIHLATLIHDDIMDGADTRRGQPTANARWGNSITVLLGDSLFAHALDLSTRFEETDISRAIARAAREVCTGELLQTQRRFDLQLSQAEYFRIIEMKTAALFGVAAELGARLNGASDAAVRALRDYGLKLGTAYQIYDDCLDLAGDEAHAGKTLGTDLQKGKLTLPMLFLLQTASENGARERINQALLNGDAASLLTLRQAARKAGALAAAATAGRTLIEEACLPLNTLGMTRYRRALKEIGVRLGAMVGQFA
ncbi:MAG: polyprenyl synthetase family protein [Verrucomicrobia bacterium]|nr:polyprenyl synthetase family protein [Verrucomicrobiota bacterium]